MTAIVEARDLSKRYGKFVALDRVSFTLQPGRIVGLIGRNGAGKTTVLKTILGLSSYRGSVRVLGMEPERDRNALMSDVCFIADSAVLPRWLTVAHAIDYVAGVHPRFDRARAEAVLATTPEVRVIARENRAFGQRAVKYLVAEAGLRQIIDIGTGIPAAGNVHQIAHEIDQDVRVVYVDNDRCNSGCSHLSFNCE